MPWRVWQKEDVSLVDFERTSDKQLLQKRSEGVWVHVQTFFLARQEGCRILRLSPEHLLVEEVEDESHLDSGSTTRPRRVRKQKVPR